jgi:mRNA-degrading endonuclease YafQ of YafQ-DinJ toxin-antitoxin module
VKHRFKTTPTFRKALRGLTASQKASARQAFGVFRNDPFDARLRTHKIHSLSARFRRNIYSVWVKADLRAVFYLDGDMVVSVDIGTHAIYR